MMEQEGIYYYFNHSDGKNELVLCDSPSAHEAFPGYAEMIFRAPTHDKNEVGEFIQDWTVEKEVQPGVYTLADFNFKTPKAPIVSNANKSRSHEQSGFEIFDYPGEFEVRDEGTQYAKIRMQELQSQHEVVRGRGTTRGVATGAKFKFKADEMPWKGQDREYMVCGVAIQADAGEYASGGGGAGEFFNCSFTVAEAAEQFRAARLTPKPIVQGPQTAIVVGKSGEEIDTDEFGRVKVQFHWDRYSKADETSSCWVRVSQTSAGKEWGAISLPRIGQEVIVEFLEGDPDLPIITGRVYNATNMPPYKLDANKTISTIKTNSSKGGGGFNEIRFEDKKGEEQIYIHGEKNQDIRIKNDTFEWVGNNQHLVVKKDQFEHVENNRDEIVDADHKEKIGKDRHLKVVGKEAKAVDGSLSLTVKGDVIEVFKSNHSEETTKDYYLKADNIVIEGMTNVTIKVGGSSIAIGADGIAMKTSATVKIESGATMDIKGGAPLTMESPMTTVKGDGMLTLKGGMVMIN
jgi:type VI secretion system secreted protein VgrG